MSTATYRVVSPSAGAGKRMGADRNKLTLELRQRPIIAWTLDVFEADPACAEIVLAINPLEKDWFTHVTSSYATAIKLVAGGAERQDSVLRGLEALEGEGIVLIHDGARPSISREAIHAVVQAAVLDQAAILAVPIEDNVKRIEANHISVTVPREHLMAAQTQQAFDLATLSTVHEKAATKNLGTDDASLIEWGRGKVTIVHGHYENVKMTTPDEL
jgi:2-C-methyl-D-erythritol 4-phosphate cytidylyltransferase